MEKEVKSIEYAIELVEVTKKFGDNTVLSDININRHEGEFFVLLGPSGCGQSTMLKIISGLEDANKGDNTGGSWGLKLDGASYTIIRGNTFQGCRICAAQDILRFTYGVSHHNLIENNVFTNAGHTTITMKGVNRL